jgi:hypothetical protein
MKVILRLAIFLALPATGLADPLLTSWFTLHSDATARLYRTDAARLAGDSVTTWSNGRQTQAQPARTGIQQILVSTNWIYIRSTGLPSQIMGPWYMDAQHYRFFPNLPTDQNILLCLPRHPVVETDAEFQHLGDIGMTVDGVAIFDPTDAFSYSHAAGRDADPRAGLGQGDGIWDRDALVNEGQTFDPGQGHQENRGRYHYHAQAIALRYELGDHVDFDPVTKTYQESAGEPTRHSPILAWLHDGYPVYGPYGYANPTNAASGLRRMISGYVPRNGQNGADDLTQTGRRRLPAWAARESDRSATLADDETGPNVSPRYPVGHFVQDYAYRGDLGQTQGQDFDLDENNGRWCVTPEFPQGTYAYFTTIDATGHPIYPYLMGKRYHGRPYGRVIRNIRERVVPYFTSAGAAAGKTSSASPGPATTTLVWQPGNDGGYQSAPPPGQ